MKVIVISKTDLASCNIFDNLMKLANWREEGNFLGNPLYFWEDLCIATINDRHIFHDNVDLDLDHEFEKRPECIIFASRHTSESGKRSLTVHPIGNFGKAEFGGLEESLVPSSPHIMTEALRILRKKAKDLDYSVSFEATHHGPFLSTPTFFIEIGSEERAWQDKEAGRAIAETLLEIRTPDYPVGLGVGGGHYVPRITDVAVEREISFGHIIPTYALESITPEMAEKVLKTTNNVEKIYFHKKHLKGGQYTKWKEYFSKKGLIPVKTGDLEKLD